MQIRILVGLVIILGGLFFTGCSISSEYILTMEYTNPNTNTIERTDIPVSQYEYNKTNVGDPYEVKIKTAVMGVRIPLTKSLSSTRISLIDMMPIVLILVALFFVGKSIYGRLKGTEGWISSFIFPLIVMGVVYIMISTIKPDFVAVGHIIDKTFQIVSG